ncbi:MAG: FmdB family zinc ribbon protein [Thermotogota bacterium]|nr:FmdB family zinc ribbon protein [Thermotogota bacterium]
MPLYPYECIECGFSEDRIEKVTKSSFKVPIVKKCPACGCIALKRIVGTFKVGKKLLETTGRSGYETDDFTMGKLIDEGGIPYEEKNRLRERDKMIKRQKEYGKKLKERGKSYNFDPFSDGQ